MPRPRGRISGFRRVKLANGESASYRPVGYRDSDGRFVTRRPGNGHWWSAKGSIRARPPSPADVEASDVVNYEVRYAGRTYFFSAEGGVQWGG